MKADVATKKKTQTLLAALLAGSLAENIKLLLEPLIVELVLLAELHAVHGHQGLNLLPEFLSQLLPNLPLSIFGLLQLCPEGFDLGEKKLDRFGVLLLFRVVIPIVIIISQLAAVTSRIPVRIFFARLVVIIFVLLVLVNAGGSGTLFASFNWEDISERERQTPNKLKGGKA